MADKELMRIYAEANELAVSDLNPITQDRIFAAMRAAANLGFERGWGTAANWANRDDLHEDIDSPAYLAEREAALRLNEA